MMYRKWLKVARMDFFVSFSFLTTLSLSGSLEPSQHMGTGRIHPWMSLQLIVETYVKICKFDTLREGTMAIL